MVALSLAVLLTVVFVRLVISGSELRFSGSGPGRAVAIFQIAWTIRFMFTPIYGTHAVILRTEAKFFPGIAVVPWQSRNGYGAA